MTLGEAMRERGISREVLAAAMGVSAARVDAWLDGRGKIHPVLFRRLRAVLGMDHRTFTAELVPTLRHPVAAETPRISPRRHYSAHLGFACSPIMREAVFAHARHAGVTPSDLMRAAVAATLNILSNKGGADAGVPQGPGRTSPRRTRPSSRLDTPITQKAQARPVPVDKSLRPRRPFSKPTNLNKGETK